MAEGMVKADFRAVLYQPHNEVQFIGQFRRLVKFYPPRGLL